MSHNEDEEKQLRAVALQNANTILAARQRAERELARERERLRITLASIGDAVISTDAEGRVTLLNGVAEALTGWRQDGDRARTNEAGCDGHLVKPVNLSDLEKLLTELKPSG